MQNLSSEKGEQMPAPKGHPPYPGCDTGGRPRHHSVEDVERFADEFKIWLNDPSHVWIKDFALDNDFDPDYLHEWAKENEKFGGVYKQAKQRQESRLVNGGLNELYNGSIVKFVLANAHGWTDKQETKVSGDAANPLAFILNSVRNTSKDLVTDDSGTGA
jgi:hypothetical protein